MRWPSGRLWWMLARLALVAAVAGGVVYYTLFAPVPAVRVEVQRGSVVAEALGTGTLEARVRVGISPKITGRLTAVRVDQRDRIAPGQLLATLDDADLRQQVEVAKANLAAAEAGVARAKADIARAEAVLTHARLEHERTTTLRQQQVASVTELDKSTEQLRIAEAELGRARAAETEAQRQAAAADQTRRYHEERLADTRIVSPFAGLVVRRHREPGDVVVPGAAILDVVATEQVWVSAWVDESAMAALAEGQPARVVFRAEPQKSYPGKVARLAPQTDRETREFLVDVALEQLPATWAIGQRAEVYLETARCSEVPVLPQRALVWRDSQPGVLVAAEGKARWRALTLGLRGRDLVEVAAGLAPGEAALLPGSTNQPLREGRAVSYP